MAKLEVNGLDGLIGDLEALAKLPDSVAEDILSAEADIVEAEQRKTARDMLSGDPGTYFTGTTAKAIKRTKVKKSSTGKSLTIYPQGKRSDGRRNAEIAFINEFGRPKRNGKKGQPARPFIRVANERAEPKAAQAGAKVYGDFLDRHGL